MRGMKGTKKEKSTFQACQDEFAKGGGSEHSPSLSITRVQFKGKDLRTTGRMDLSLEERRSEMTPRFPAEIARNKVMENKIKSLWNSKLDMLSVR